MHIKPLADKILVRRIEHPNQSKGGILLIDEGKQKSNFGFIEEVGPGKLNNEGILVPMKLQKGQQVLFSKYAGSEVLLESDQLLIMKEEDVLAIVEEEISKV